ncbi:MAG: hypothetical protein JWM16_4488 [Verrucomicrobiales bacterium]|nr:hypothetical protein [Verrucomicrobiales bacterium]
MNLKTTWLAWLVIFSLQSPIVRLCAAPQKELPLPGEVFVVDGRTAFLIAAKGNGATKTKPWVWYAPTLPGLPGKEEQWMFKRFLEAGIAIGGIDVGESYGSPAGRKFFTEFHAEMTRTRGYSSKPILLGRSRGGLMTLSWAAENPDKVGGFAGIYPVSNFASYPGITNAAGAYGMKPEELQAQLAEQNPIERLAPLAWAGVPLFAIHGDVDKVVPLELNSGLLHERYTALGGSMQLIIPPGQGHNMWPGFFQNEDLVSFVKAHAGPNITITSPLDYQVVQRSSKSKGSLLVRGELAGVTLNTTLTIQARLVLDGKPRKWRRLAMDPKRSTFQADLEAPGGGWHRVEARALSGDEVMAESVIEHVGIGEVFVIAGQSNSANHGAEKQNSTTGLVAAFDGTRWRLAHDPQPGASGEGGSFIPPFGDAIVQKFHVPVGIVACGVGATSVREWLAKDATFPNPPTLTNNVRQLPSGAWESTGTLFVTFTGRMKQLGPRGFRAVLWHQGESDANQDDPTRTLPGNLYRDYLEQLIDTSRREIGWKAPWFVAQASYHVPGDEGSPEIRGAQASLWKDGLALEGPDSDSIKGDLRENGGKGVHFSGPGLREHAARWFDKVAPWLERNK